jgi:hypothetical protein
MLLLGSGSTACFGWEFAGEDVIREKWTCADSRCRGRPLTAAW